MQRGRAYRRHQKDRARRRAERKLLIYLGDKDNAVASGVTTEWLREARCGGGACSDNGDQRYWRKWLYLHTNTRTVYSDSLWRRDYHWERDETASRATLKRRAIEEQLQ